MKKIILIALLFGCLSMKAQNPFSLMVDTIAACPPNEVLVPVKVLNFTNVAACNFNLLYDNTALLYLGTYANNSVQDSGFLVVNNVNLPGDTGKFMFAWFGLSEISIPDHDTLITLRFQYLGGTSYLLLDTSNVPGNPVTFVNGAVIPQNISLVQQPIDMTVTAGNQAFFYAATQNSAWVNPNWQVSTNGGITWTNLTNTPPYTGVNNDLLLIDTADFGMNNYLYRYFAIGCDTIISQAVTLTVLSGITFEGTLTYDNGPLSSLVNATVKLLQNNNIVYTINPDTAGYFAIPNVVPGNYSVAVDCFEPWGGNTAADALAVLQHFVGMITLTGLPLQAADIDLANGVNSTDALLILKRFVGLINQYPGSDWIFDTNMVSIPTSGLWQDIQGICRGDVNGSYLP